MTPSNYRESKAFEDKSECTPPTKSTHKPKQMLAKITMHTAQTTARENMSNKKPIPTSMFLVKPQASSKKRASLMTSPH